MDELDLDAIDLKKVTKTKRQECEDLIAEIRKLREERNQKSKEVESAQVDTLAVPLKDASVKNIRYGAGKVVSCEGQYLTVSFSGDVEKKFQFPNAFLQGFLTVDDAALEDEIKRIRSEADGKNALKQELDELKREILRSELKLNAYLK